MTVKKAIDKEFYQDVIEWDVPNWSGALRLWTSYLDKNLPFQNLKGIEIGARSGGLSLYFAREHSVYMYCTDYGGPPESARVLHEKYGVSEKIEYADVNAFQIPFEDSTFDIVVFKSLLGVLGHTSKGKDKESQHKAMNEFHRVLKPGGVLLFAENLKASGLHQLTRRVFIPWGSKWRYVTVSEMKEFLEPFQKVEYKTFGFVGAFLRNSFLKRFFQPVERALNKVLPEAANYIIYGAATR